MIRSRTRFLAYASMALAVVALANPVVAADPVATDGAKPMVWPTSGRVTQPYGCTGFFMEPRYGSCRHFHGGIDIANSRGTPIRAAADGVVTHVGWDPWGHRNWMVMINHGGGLTTWYAHLRDKHISDIRKGVRVRQGEVVGYMSDTGHATGVHLHWAVLKNGAYVNPRNYVAGELIKPRKRGAGTGAAACDNIWIAGLTNGATTAIALEGDNLSGGRDATCAA